MSSDWLDETQIEKPLGEWMQDRKEEMTVKLEPSCEDGISEQVRARTTTENEKDNIKVYVCSLSLTPHDNLFLTV